MALAIKTAEHSVFVMLDLHTETCGRATTSASMRSGQCEGEKSTFELWTFVVHSCDMLPSRASTSAFLAATHFHVSCRMGRKSLFNREGMTARQCTPIVVQGTERMHLQFVGRARTRYSGRECKSTDQTGLLNDSIGWLGSKRHRTVLHVSLSMPITPPYDMPCKLNKARLSPDQRLPCPR